MPHNRRIIAVVHRGYSWYLPYVLRQLKVFNRGAEVVLFAERRRILLAPYCRTVLVQDYMGTARELEGLFENLSPNSAAYELFCLQRWGILLEYAERHALAELVHLDSDVMVYCNLWEMIDRDWQNHDFVVTGWQGPQTLFVRNIAALRGFWNHMVAAYRDDLTALRTAHAQWQAAGKSGGVSDMHFLHEFVARGEFRFGDNSQPRGGAVFDQSANQPDGYVHSGEIKHLGIRNSVPHGLCHPTGQPMRFHSLHFQGMSKKHIPRFSTRRTPDLHLFGLINRLQRKSRNS